MLVEQFPKSPVAPAAAGAETGKPTHAKMGVSSSDCDALVGKLVGTLNKFKVPDREKNELLGAFGVRKGDIVERPMASMQ